LRFLESATGMTVLSSKQSSPVTSITKKTLQRPALPDYDERRCLNLYSETELSKNIADYITDCVAALGYEEDTTYSNARLLLTGSACAIAIVATLCLKFPEHRLYMALCVVAFFVLLFLLFLLDMFVIKNSIIAIKTKNGRFFIDLSIERGSGDMSLSLRSSNRTVPCECKRKLEQHFDEEGYFVPSSIFDQLKTVLEAIESEDSRKSN